MSSVDVKKIRLTNFGRVLALRNDRLKSRKPLKVDQIKVGSKKKILHNFNGTLNRKPSFKKILEKPADLVHLQQERQRLRLASKADSTWGQYGPAFERFAKWCVKEKREFLPASSETVELFLTQLADWFKTPHSASMAFAAIAAQHKLKGQRPIL